MCYACEHPLNASTDEKSVWLKEYREWAQCDEAEAQSIYDEIVENADPLWGAENYLLETQYCECGGGEEECDPEAETDDEEEECDPEAETDDEEEPDSIFAQFLKSQSVGESLARYREEKKKVLDSFELIKNPPPTVFTIGNIDDEECEEPEEVVGQLPDLYRDIESGRIFDLAGCEYLFL
tara:strand:+ start:378 stop:920 length:543 start_codon:yes stop_codon:yes gene_type:complete